MTEKQFRAKIKVAKSKLKEKKYGEFWFRGVCVALAISFDTCWDTPYEIPMTFSQIFAPREHGLYWLGLRNNENLDKRIDFLNHFEEYMIVNQYYLAF